MFGRFCSFLRSALAKYLRDDGDEANASSDDGPKHAHVTFGAAEPDVVVVNASRFSELEEEMESNSEDDDMEFDEDGLQVSIRARNNEAGYVTLKKRRAAKRVKKKAGEILTLDPRTWRQQYEDGGGTAYEMPALPLSPTFKEDYLSAATRWVEEQMEKWAEDYENRKKVKMNKSRLRWLKAITLTVAEVNTNWIRTAAMLQGMKEHEADLSCANESALAVKRRLKGEQKEAAKRAKEIAAKIEADKKKLKAEADAAAQKSKNTHKQTKNAHKELEEKQKVAAEKRKKKQLADLEKKKAAALLKSRRWVTQQLTRLKKSDAETRAKAALALEGADLNSNIENAMKRIYKAEEAAAEKREIAAKKAGLEVEDTSDHFDIKLDKVKTLRRKKTGGEEDDEEDVFPDMEPRPSTVRPSLVNHPRVVLADPCISPVLRARLCLPDLVCWRGGVAHFLLPRERSWRACFMFCSTISPIARSNARTRTGDTRRQAPVYS